MSRQSWMMLRNWGNTLTMMGRLKPGVTVAQAQAEVDILMPQIRAAHKDWYNDYATAMTGLKDHVSGKLRRSLVVLWCAVGMILLIVCVNLSNLLLARAAARGKEFALRSALGAGRARIVRQLLTESLVLASGGAVLGLGIAFAVTWYLARQGSIALPLLSTIRVDGAALGWTLLIALAAAVLFGLAPSLKISGGNLQDALKDAGHGMSAGRKHDRMRAVLVVSEVALACVLLVGAGSAAAQLSPRAGRRFGIPAQPGRRDQDRLQRWRQDPSGAVRSCRKFCAACPQFPVSSRPASWICCRSTAIEAGASRRKGRVYRKDEAAGRLRLYRDAGILGRHRHAIARGPRL
jgi:hypothetical protein